MPLIEKPGPKSLNKLIAGVKKNELKEKYCGGSLYKFHSQTWQLFMQQLTFNMAKSKHFKEAYLLNKILIVSLVFILPYISTNEIF